MAGEPTPELALNTSLSHLSNWNSSLFHGLMTGPRVVGQQSTESLVRLRRVENEQHSDLKRPTDHLGLYNHQTPRLSLRTASSASVEDRVLTLRPLDVRLRKLNIVEQSKQRRGLGHRFSVIALGVGERNNRPTDPVS